MKPSRSIFDALDALDTRPVMTWGDVLAAGSFLLGATLLGVSVIAALLRAGRLL